MKLLNDDLIPVGKVVKPIGIKGWLKVKYFSNNVENLLSLKALFVERNKEFFSYEIEGLKRLKGFFAVKFNKINGVDEAKELKDCLIYAAKDSLVPLKDGEFYLADLIGFDVLDSKKEYLGKVFSFVEVDSDRSLIVVKKEDKEILIPLIEEFVKDVNSSEKLVLVELPDGFV